MLSRCSTLAAVLLAASAPRTYATEVQVDLVLVRCKACNETRSFPQDPPLCGGEAYRDFMRAIPRCPTCGARDAEISVRNRARQS